MEKNESRGRGQGVRREWKFQESVPRQLVETQRGLPLLATGDLG